VNTRGHILIVDDEPPIREFLSWALEDEGYRVQLAAHGQAALAILAVFQPQLIILDMWMPVMDGWTFLKTYRQLPIRLVPVLAFSAVDLDIRQARAGGIADFIEKPCDLDKLLACVADHLASFVRGQPGSA
jgi:CheY-like chemotaxis protein